VLTNKFHIGIVEWNGIEYEGRHEPLVSPELFYRVQDLLSARGVRSTRERKHNHYLKGLLTCGACGRGLCIQEAKGGKYVYFFCLGMRSKRANTGCREGYVLVDALEAQIKDLYTRLQLPDDLAARLRHEFEAEIVELMARSADERNFQSRRRVKLEDKRRKLMDAYYAGAVTLAVLRQEQDQIDAECREVEECLVRVDAKLAEWQDTMDLAIRLVRECGRSYANASPKTRRMFNAAVFASLRVAGGQITEAEYRQPFDLILSGRWAGLGVPSEAHAVAVGESSNSELWLGRKDLNLRMADPKCD